MSEYTIKIDFDPASLKKYWLTVSVFLFGLWTQLAPGAKQQIIGYAEIAVHKHPSLTIWAAIAVAIGADLKQSPFTPTKPKPAVTEAPRLDRSLPSQ